MATRISPRIVIIAVAAVAVIGLAWLCSDLWLKSSREITCDDGPRRTIDIRDFTTQYWAYAVELEGNLGEQGKLATKLDPKQLQQISEAMQEAREFRQFLVAGYNSCAFPRAEYARFGARFQALDNLARRIDAAATAGQATVEPLVRQYVALTQSLAEQAR